MMTRLWLPALFYATSCAINSGNQTLIIDPFEPRRLSDASSAFRNMRAHANRLKFVSPLGSFFVAAIGTRVFSKLDAAMRAVSALYAGRFMTFLGYQSLQR